MQLLQGLQEQLRFRWLLSSEWKERASTSTCVCKRPAATVRVCRMSGDVVEIGVGEQWTVLEAKRKLAKVIKVPAREQCWSFKQRLLQDSALLETLESSDGPPEVLMALRDPEVAMWMERIGADWTVVKRELENVPQQVWKSSEVILEILQHTPEALRYADAELFDDANFLLSACELRGYDKTSAEPVRWLQTIADCKLCLSYAIKQNDIQMAETAIRCEHVISKASRLDIASFVVYAFFCDVLESDREYLLTLLAGLPHTALSHLDPKPFQIIAC